MGVNLFEMTTKSLPEETETHRYPYLSTRIISTFVDNIIVLAVILMYLELTAGTQVPIYIHFGIILIILSYEPILTAYGATLGQYLMRIRVRKNTSYNNAISFPYSYFRVIVKWALGWLSLLTVTAREDKKALHDLFSGSVVINVSD